MTRQTSIDAYHKIRDEGLLGLKQFIVYETLFKSENPMTAGEIFVAMKQSGDKIIVKGGVSARLTDMREMGCVRECGTRKCNVTGHTVITWEVSGELPVDVDKKESKDQLIARLQMRIKELELQANKSQNCMFCRPSNAGH